MFASLMYKEWLKIRWTFAGMSLLFLLVILYIYLHLSYIMRINESYAVWYTVIFRGYQFYNYLLYIPLLVGVAIGIAQFVPESTAGRLKLSLHLPMNDQKMLALMNLFGFSIIWGVYILMVVLLSLITIIYFSTDVLWSVLETTIPWLLAGSAGYFAVAFIIMEPLWIRRIIYAIISYAVINSFLVNSWYSAYTPVFPAFILLSVCFALFIQISGHRFKRGVR